MSDGIKIGGVRLLTLGEINLAKTLYGLSIRYNEVWIHRGSYLPFNMQNFRTAMTPNGEIYFMEGTYENDFSMSHQRMSRIVGAHLFLHEMMHVWQHQHGMMVRLRGAFSWAVDYSYHLDKHHLLDYGLEQQASIVSDFCLLNTYGFDPRSNLHKLIDYDPSEPKQDLLRRYEALLGDFPQ
ncbi:type IV secretion protein Rhs [Enterobacter asburiae]|uniref:type IV secretion protein Rhs n=1 Tax=Enterobacter asburiae TaxID=61645 RepID=UPI001CC02F4E|nr:type IV secretion protein Rhs [Enterobacter asburiae]UAN36473.1 type IV secretion protein Rhs [Enterobacter asburiae]